MASPRMTSTEFAAARQRLGWTAIEAAVEYNVTPNVIEAFERGSVKIPKAIAHDIRFRSAARERQEVLAASGLPVCAVLHDLDRLAGEKKGDELIDACNAVVAHAESCALCRERSEYAERHGPPLPELPTSMLFRVASWASALLDRLPGALRPPEGKAGVGRRTGFLAGVALSAFACAMVVLFTVARVMHVGWVPRWWGDLAALGLIVPAYFFGLYVAGCVWDALRPIHDRFIGYVLRFGLAGLAIYGAIAVVMPILDDDHMSLRDSLEFLAFIGGVWALIGVGVWIKDRFWAKLARR